MAMAMKRMWSKKTRREKAIARLDKWKAERKVRRNQSI